MTIGSPSTEMYVVCEREREVLVLSRMADDANSLRSTHRTPRAASAHWEAGSAVD